MRSVSFGVAFVLLGAIGANAVGVPPNPGQVKSIKPKTGGQASTGGVEPIAAEETEAEGRILWPVGAGSRCTPCGGGKQICEHCFGKECQPPEERSCHHGDARDQLIQARLDRCSGGTITIIGGRACCQRGPTIDCNIMRGEDVEGPAVMELARSCPVPGCCGPPGGGDPPQCPPRAREEASTQEGVQFAANVCPTNPSCKGPPGGGWPPASCCPGVRSNEDAEFRQASFVERLDRLTAQPLFP